MNKVDKTKKSHCLRNCIITSIVIIVVLFGALFGGAYFAYGKFAEPILGIPMFDAFDVIGGIGKYKKEDIVTNPYDPDKDLKAFYTNLETATYLDLPADFSIATAVNEVMKSNTPEGGGNVPNPEGGGNMPVPPEGGGSVPTPEGGGSVPTPAPSMSRVAMAGEPVAPDVPAPEPAPAPGPLDSLKTFTTGNAYLDSVLKQTKFSFDKLGDTSQVGKDLVLEDKQFAAVINEVLTNLDIQQIKDLETKLGVPFKELVSVTQVTISGAPTAEKIMLAGEPIPVPGTDEPQVDDPRKDVKIELVVCVNLGDNVKKILANAAPQLPAFVGSLATAMLPKELFIGVGVFPYSKKAPTIFINGIVGKKMENALTAINGVLNYTGSEQNVDQLFGMIAETVNTTIMKMEGMVGSLIYKDSSMSMDPITALMTVLKVNVPNENGVIEHYVNSQAFFTMLKHIYNTDNSLADGTPEALEKYINDNVGIENRNSKDKYVENIVALGTSYGIDSTYVNNNMAKWTPNEFVTNYKEVPAHINVVSSDITIKDEANNEKKVKIYEATQAELAKRTKIDDNALGYMLDNIIDEKFKEGIAGIPFKLSVESFVLYDNNAGDLRARFVAGVSLKDILKGMEESVLYMLLGSIIPKQLFVEFDVPMSGGQQNTAGLILNFVGKDEEGRELTKGAFDTLYRIVKALNPDTGEQIKLENLLARIQQIIEDMLKQLNDAMQEFENKTPAPAPAPEPPAPAPALAGETTEEKTPMLAIEAGGIKLPTIYDIIKVMTFSKDVTADDIQKALKGMYTYTPIDIVADKAKETAAVNAFIADELKGKLFLKGDIKPETLFDTMTTLGDKVQLGVGEVIDARGLIESPETDVNKYKLAITAAQLAGIVNSSGKLKDVSKGLPYTNISAVVGQTSIRKVGTTTDYVMEITIRAELDAAALGEAPLGIKYDKILPGELQISALIKVSGADKYKTSILINGITEETKKTLDLIMGGISSGEEKMSFAKIEEIIGGEMSKALDSMTSITDELQYSDEGVGKITAMSVFDVIYDKLIAGKLTEADKAKLSANPAQDIMNIFKGALAEVTVTPFVEDEIVMNGIATDLNDKLLLRDGTIKKEGIIESIKGITASSETANSEVNLFGYIEPTKLWLENGAKFDTVDKMNVSLNEEQLTNIMAKEIKEDILTGLPSIFSAPQLTSIKITADDKATIEFAMSIGKPKDPNDKSFDNILPFMPTHMVVKVDIDMTDPLLYKSDLILNALKPADKDKASVLLKALAPAEAGTNGFDIDKITESVNANLTKSLNKLDDVGMKFKFRLGGDGIGRVETGNIFKVMKKVSDKFNADGVTEAGLHRIMRGLYDPDPTKMFVNPRPANTNADIEEITSGGFGIAVSDKYIAYNLFAGGDLYKKGSLDSTPIGQIKQMAILSGDGMARAKSKFDTMYAPGTLTKERGIVMSIEAQTKAFSANIDATGFNTIVPDKLVTTLIFDIPVNGSKIGITPIINNMNMADMDLLMKLLSMDTKGNVINQIETEISEQVLSRTIKHTITNALLPGGSISIDLSLKDVLTSDKTEYVNVQTGGTPLDGVYGKIKYMAPLAP